MAESQTTSAAVPVGAYVLATKYDDGDPGDHWAVGFYLGRFDHFGQTRHLVGDKDGKSFRANGFRRVGVIERDFGEWLLRGADFLESSPPGSVNLWRMQEGTTRAMEKLDAKVGDQNGQ